MTKLHLKIKPSKAVNDVLIERVRQLSQEGYDAKHDDAHIHGELALAAAAYLGHSLAHVVLDTATELQALAPWAIRYKTPRDSLIKAAGLILAQIERLDRIK